MATFTVFLGALRPQVSGDGLSLIIASDVAAFDENDVPVMPDGWPFGVIGVMSTEPIEAADDVDDLRRKVRTMIPLYYTQFTEEDEIVYKTMTT